jgi:hypothetical protein
MTRADYEMIAAVLASVKPDVKHGTVGEKRVWASIVRGLTARLAEGHPRFDVTRFHNACGYTGEGL